MGQDLLQVECLRVVAGKDGIGWKNPQESIDVYIARVARAAADLHLKYSHHLQQNDKLLNGTP